MSLAIETNVADQDMERNNVRDIAATAEQIRQVDSIAVLGASAKSFFSRVFLHTLLGNGFEGTVYPIHLRDDTVMDLPAYPSVEALPADPDMGVLVLRADRCLGAIKDLYARGCKLVLVLSDGFAETGDADGIALQGEMEDYCREHDIVLIGPNCIGLADFNRGLVALGAPLPTGIQAGRVSLVAQSGALLVSMLIGFQQERVGVDLAVSIGNASGLDVIDSLELCLQSDKTSVVCAYVEGFGSDVARLERVLAHAKSLNKRVILLKSGKSETAQRIAMSHTASIAGSAAYSEALLARHDVVAVGDIEEMVRAAALEDCFADASAGLFVLTSTGGGASIASDLAAEHGVGLTELTEETLERLRALMPASGFIGNPMDMSGQVASGQVSVADVYDVLFADPGVGVVLFVGPTGFPDDSADRDVHRKQLEDIVLSTEKHDLRLVVASVANQSWTDWIASFVERHPTVLAVSGLGATMAGIGRLHAAERSRAPLAPTIKHESSNSSEQTTGIVLDEAEGREVLAKIGFPIVAGSSVGDADDAGALASRLGFPVVVKGVLPGVSHKFAIGGVILGLHDEAAVVAACNTMTTTMTQREDVTLQGFLVEQMVTGIEFIVGLTRHEMFGPAMTFGLGGVLAETTSLNATALLPLAEQAGFEPIFRRAGLDRLMSSFPPQTYRTIVDSLHRLSEAFVSGDLQDFSTAEVNPLFVTATGDVLAGDVLLLRQP